MKNVRVIGLLTLCFLLGLVTVATISGCSEKKDDTGDVQQETTDSTQGSEAEASGDDGGSKHGVDGINSAV